MAARERSKSAKKPASGQRKTALITGASAGIGAALARNFAKGGYDLVLVARSAGKLRDLAAELHDAYGVTATVVPADLLKAGAVKKLHTTLTTKKIEIDVLVNNAGMLEIGSFVKIPHARQMDQIKLNVLGLTDLTHTFLPGMLARKSGRILNVASIAAFQPVPSLATYAATKAFVLSLTEALSEELKGTGVTVTALCPGLTATDMVGRAQTESAAAAKLPDMLISDVESVAREGYEACQKGEVIRVPGIMNQAAMLMSRSTPKWLVRAIAGAMGRMAI